MNETVSIDIRTLKLLLQGQQQSRQWVCGEVRKAVLRAETLLRDHERQQQVQAGENKIRHGDIVEPLPSCNYLRAGNTAYSRAVVLQLDPFYIVSEDGRFDWRDCRPENFVVVGAVTPAMLATHTRRWRNR